MGITFGMSVGIMPSTLDPELSPKLSASLPQVTLKDQQPLPSSLEHSDAKENKRKAPWIDLISTMKSRTCKFLLLALLIISVFLVVLVVLLAIKPWRKSASNQPTTIKTPMAEGKSSAKFESCIL